MLTIVAALKEALRQGKRAVRMAAAYLATLTLGAFVYSYHIGFLNLPERKYPNV